MRWWAALLAVILLATAVPLRADRISEGPAGSDPAAARADASRLLDSPRRRRSRPGRDANNAVPDRAPGPSATETASAKFAKYAMYSTVELAAFTHDYREDISARIAVEKVIVSRGAAAARELAPLLASEDAEHRSIAVAGLSTLGEIGLPWVLEQLGQGNAVTRNDALATLEDIVEDGALEDTARARMVAALVRATRYEDASDPDLAFDNRTRAAELLAGMPEALSLLEARLRDGPEQHRLAALRALGSGSEVTSRARKIVESFARDEHQPRPVRLAAAHTLSQHVAVGAPVENLPALEGVPEVRLWALAAAADTDEWTDADHILQTRAGEARGLFLEAARTVSDEDEDGAAARAVSFLAANGEEPPGTWIELAGSARSAAARARALELLEERADSGGLTASAAAVRARCVASLHDADEEVRHCAAATLAALRTEGIDVAADLAAAIAAPGGAARAAAWAVTDIEGCDDERIRDALSACALDRDRGDAERAEAFGSLEELFPARALEIAGALTADGPAEVRCSAVWALASSDEAAGLEAGDLEAVGRNGAPWGRRAIAKLADRCLEPDAAVRLLVPLLSDESEPVVKEAAAALGRLGEDARAAVPALRAALLDRHGCVRTAIAGAFASIPDEAKAAVPDLAAAFRRALRAEVRGALIHPLRDLGWTPERGDIALLLPFLRSCPCPHHLCRAPQELLDAYGRGPGTAEIVRIARKLEHKELERAVQFLGDWSQGEPEVLRLLGDALESGDYFAGCTGVYYDVPGAAKRALHEIGKGSPEGRRALEDARRRAKPGFRKALADTLAGLGAAEGQSDE